MFKRGREGSRKIGVASQPPRLRGQPAECRHEPKKASSANGVHAQHKPNNPGLHIMIYELIWRPLYTTFVSKPCLHPGRSVIVENLDSKARLQPPGEEI